MPENDFADFSGPIAGSSLSKSLTTIPLLHESYLLFAGSSFFMVGKEATQ
jgi:hypothetical protein